MVKDSALAQHAENYMLRFDDLKKRSEEMNRIREYLRTTIGPLVTKKASRKARKVG